MDLPEDLSTKETHHLFPSGEWEGFYTYEFGEDAGRHTMSFTLIFSQGKVHGFGGDDVGSFKWGGYYDTGQMTCKMIKFYITHRVVYDGNVDENGIWGTWMIENYLKGGFHIWPKSYKASKKMEAKASIPEKLF